MPCPWLTAPEPGKETGREPKAATSGVIIANYDQHCDRPQKQNNLPHKTTNMDGTIRANIKPGMLVNIILKKDQRTGVLTEGVVKNILTSAPKHHRGIKVRLEDGQIGRVQEILEEDTD
jgi:uncharacterized repeat protein (TIGR03833 family)